MWPPQLACFPPLLSYKNYFMRFWNGTGQFFLDGELEQMGLLTPFRPHDARKSEEVPHLPSILLCTGERQQAVPAFERGFLQGIQRELNLHRSETEKNKKKCPKEQVVERVTWWAMELENYNSFTSITIPGPSLQDKLSVGDSKPRLCLLMFLQAPCYGMETLQPLHYLSLSYLAQFKVLSYHLQGP